VECAGSDLDGERVALVVDGIDHGVPGLEQSVQGNDVAFAPET
jgi:hypothetical protein